MYRVVRDMIHRAATAIVTGTLFLGPLGVAAFGPLFVPHDELVTAVFQDADPVAVRMPYDLFVEDSTTDPSEPAEQARSEGTPSSTAPTPSYASTAPPQRTGVGGMTLEARRARELERAEKARRSAARNDKCTATYDGVEKVDDTHYRVRRTFVDEYKSPKKLETVGWTSRHEDETGKPDGFKVGGFGCNGVLFHVGLRRGDVVHTVNGHRVTSIPSAIATYIKVRNDDDVVLVVTRKGERLTLHYRML